jgi:hypothetical protein
MDMGPFEINRSAVIAIAKQPFIDWLHAVDPSSQDIDLSIVNREPSVYLVPVFESDEDFMEWLEEHCDIIFEEQLAGWWTDERSWPPHRGIEVFEEWFECHRRSMVWDLDDEPL